MSEAPRQLALGISLHEETTFDNFVLPQGQNPLLLDHLLSVSRCESAEQVLLWGAPGAGLSHLLQAMCHQAHANGHSVQYLPLADLVGYDPNALCEGLEQVELLCVDGIEICAGRGAWEQALFHLYNRLKETGHSFVVASHQSPQSLSITLPDLRSRLLAGVVHQVLTLSDDDKLATLVSRAEARGMDLPEEVARFILTRGPRDTHLLFELLERLDEASLQAQRKLTIPFVKTVLSVDRP